MKKLLFLLPLLLLGVTYAEPLSYETRALEHYGLLNEYRWQNWLIKLQWSDELANCIKQYLILQINNNFEWHYWQDGKSTPNSRCGYTNMIGIGENLIASTNYFPTSFRALDLWKGSALHNKNMLLTWYNYVGVAAVWDPIKKVSRRGQLFAMNTRTTTNNNVSLTYNITITWQQNSTTPKLLSRSIWEASSVIRWGKKLLRLPLILERNVDRTKISNLSQTLVMSLVNILGPMQ